MTAQDATDHNDNQHRFRCPRCRQPVAWQGNPFRPFCSEKCRQIDLGCWAAEEYRVPDRPAPRDQEGEVIPFPQK